MRSYQLSYPQGRKLEGTISLPFSKSISNRLLIIQSLSPEGFNIDHLSDSDDTKVLQAGLHTTSDLIDVGHAGTSMRFLTAYVAATQQMKIITGSERMKQRPIGALVDALNQLGAGISYLEKEGYPPLNIPGNVLSGDTIKIDGNISSQFISALLLVAPSLANGLNIHISGVLVSVPYVKMTLGLMRQAGIDAAWRDNVISIVPQTYYSNGMTSERDWSAASYWYQIAALSADAELLLEGVLRESWQGDSVVASLFSKLGIETTYAAEGALLAQRKTDKPALLNIDFMDVPDLAQTMAVTLCLLDIPFRFTGVKTLRVKETDRIAALQNELLKLGYCIEANGQESIEWNRKKVEPQSNISIATYHDHRMAMAFAPAAILFPGIQIEDPGVVSKSYPAFWDDLKKVGFAIEEVFH